MMNSFAEYFKNRILSPRLEEVYQKYLLLKNRYKYSIFVEGYMDKHFYSILLFYRLNTNFKGDIYAYVCNGKRGVIDVCNYLFDKQMINANSKNIINIVDRDFDVLNKNECKIKNKISVTKYYSLESYAFIKNNLDIILNYLRLNEVLKKEFYTSLDKYLLEILDYEALLMLSVNFSFDYISTDLLDGAKILRNGMLESSFKEIVDNKIQSLSRTNYDKYETAKSMLSKNYLYYRGHDLEKFFNSMMEYQNISVKLQDILGKDEIINKFKIELDIK